MITFRTQYILLLAALLLLPLTGYAQSLKPAPTFNLLESGYGAPALGMGGAFTAVANDLSAIYWNPAGVGQLTGIQFSVDYEMGVDSDEDFAAESLPNRFDSEQRFSLSGNQFRAFSASYAFDTKEYRFVPFFAWQRNSFSFPERELKETAGLVNFLTPRVFVQSEGLFSETRDGGEEEWSFGLAAMVSGQILFGGSLNLLAGSPETHLTGTIHDSLVSDTGTVRTDISANQTTREEISGSYLRVGLLFFPQGPIRLGTTMRFPYTRSSDLTVQNNSLLNSNGIQTQLDQSATAETELDVPMQWSAGVAMQSSGALVSFSYTYSDWSDAVQAIKRSSDLELLPETELPYPSLRATAVQQSLMQFRVGTEYAPKPGQAGVSVRGGYFWDGQPYGTERKYFTGYSFGAGYMARSFRIDAAYVRQSGDTRLTPFSSGDSSFSHSRFVISASFLSPQ